MKTKDKLLQIVKDNSVNELPEIQSNFLYNKYLALLEKQKQQKQNKFESAFITTAFVCFGIVSTFVLIFQ